MVGRDVDLEIFRGKKLLIVNVASLCGYTPQYKGLQELYESHGDKIEICLVMSLFSYHFCSN